MNRLEAIRELAKHDHRILTLEQAQELATPFGVTVKPATFDLGLGRIVGVGAHVLAHQLAASLGLREGQDYLDVRDVGSQLRAACAAVEEYLESTNNEGPCGCPA